MPLSLFDDNKKKNWTFAKINIIFGYSNSGKTSVLSDLSSVFEGKNKAYLLNGGKILPGDFNVVSLPSGCSLSTHLKLNSKSFLRKILENRRYSPQFLENSKEIHDGLEKMEEELSSAVNDMIPGARTIIANKDNVTDLLLENLDISIENESSSYDRKSMFSLISALSKTSINRTVVFVDDFNDILDEETTIALFEEMERTDAFFFLSTNRSIPQILLSDDVSIFAMRDYKLIAVPPLSDLVIGTLEEKEKYASFEEYMLGKGYVESSGINEIVLNEIKEDERNNILRILTSKNPVISDVQVPGTVTIRPRSSQEEKIYKTVFDILGIANQ